MPPKHVLPFVHPSPRETRRACRYRNGGFRGRAGGRVYIIVTVILATGLMSSPASQNAMPSHMIIEIGMWGSSASLSGLKPVPVSVPASYIHRSNWAVLTLDLSCSCWNAPKRVSQCLRA